MSDVLATVSKLAYRQLELEKTIAQKELELEGLKKQLQQVKTVDLPEYLTEMGLSSFSLADGSEVYISRSLRAYVKEQDQPRVYTWLKSNNHGSIIKTDINAKFGMSEVVEADQAYNWLLKQGIKANKKESIHWSTFASFVKECLQNGIPLHDDIQVQHLSEVKIKIKE